MFILFILSIVQRIPERDKFRTCEQCKRDFKQFVAENTSFSKNISSQFNKICGNDKHCQTIFHKVELSLLGQTKASNPEEFCSILGKCRPKMSALSLPDENQFSKRKPRPQYHAQLHSADGNDPEGNCNYCKTIFDYLTGEALQDITVPVFMKLVKVMCDNLPPASAICEQVTNHHVEKLIMLVTSKFENQELCQSAGLCPPKN